VPRSNRRKVSAVFESEKTPARTFSLDIKTLDRNIGNKYSLR
jgi:hypothetical protein